MARDVMHVVASKSWWSGTITTACGLKVDSSETNSVWFPSLSGNIKCPACMAAHKAR
ncbi:hypothetical protein SK571_40860 [Lentzea sp. BCCO 10_0798]|uniref:Uncharacterized protein n=1 Tax=Lentzea kristufekii TaxID=3095430 RepID=A0ABU4U5H3_9PSEU|nr:hypothetical protein [Lentzea sp. BCCO 10_0798]MDX8055766.1 hypothetical protein [Lentzea sp. BCCO 10_0798]